MASAAGFSSSLSIPANLSETLANPRTPWLVSDSITRRMESVPESSLYKRCLITPRDLEWDFVHRYFDFQRPTNRSIKRIFCIHNPVAITQFEAQIKNSEAETKNPAHAPQWQKEDLTALRKKTHERWQAITALFPRLALDPRQASIEKIKILPLWHGTKEANCPSICETGFTTFGKHHRVSGGSEGAGKVVDIGYFGSGLYFTTSARYAAEIYGNGNLFLAWVSMREPYPVVADKICQPPREPKDMKILKAQGHYQGYNAHYIPVISVKPTDPKCAIYYPCAEGQTPAWDEIVVFNKSQTLPLFWIELQADLLKSPSLPIPTVQELLENVSYLLSSEQVKQDTTVLCILETKHKLLVPLNPQEPLSENDQEFYLWTKQLLDQAEKAKKAADQRLLKIKTEEDRLALEQAKLNIQKAEQAQLKAEQARKKVEQALKLNVEQVEQARLKAEQIAQAQKKIDQIVLEHEQLLKKIEQARLKIEQAQNIVEQVALEFRQALERAEKASLEAEQASKRPLQIMSQIVSSPNNIERLLSEASQANNKAYQAVERLKQAKEDAEQAKNKTEKAVLELKQAEREAERYNLELEQIKQAKVEAEQALKLKIEQLK